MSLRNRLPEFKTESELIAYARDRARYIAASGHKQGGELIVKLCDRLDAEGWQPIETAPRTRPIQLWRIQFDGTGYWDVACFDLDEFSKKPRPFWKSDQGWMSVQQSRRDAPTHWKPIGGAPEAPSA